MHHILQFIDDIETLTRGKGLEDVSRDLALELSLEKLLQNIGEAVSHLSDDIKALAPDIQWRRAVDMRNAIVHGYDDVDESIIWATIQTKIPDLRQAVLAILEEIEHDSAE